MPDLSVISIAGYYLVNFFPHAYALSLVTTSKNPKAYNNAQARNSNDAIEKALGPASFATYQRAKAAHTNGLECLPLFASAVLFGKHAGMDMDSFAITTLVLRALYVALYINTTNPRKSYIRTLVWLAEIGLDLTTIVKAGLALK